MITTTMMTIVWMVPFVCGQQGGEQKIEAHPPLNHEICRSSASDCQQFSSEAVIDANWRWLHEPNAYTNCYNGGADGGSWSVSPDEANRCGLEGIPEEEYKGTYGV